MKLLVAWAFVVGGLAAARLAHHAARAEHGDVEVIEEPFAPSEQAARFASFAYNELVADLLYVRLRGYYGGFYDTSADSVAALGEAIATVDPYFERIYTFAANAMTIAPRGVNQETFLRSIALLERGLPLFPRNWDIPLVAGQMYLQDLQTTDPVQRRRWDEKGVALVEAAARRPGAPVKATGDWAAVIRSRLGQRERAISGLRELLLTTKDRAVQTRLTARLAKIEESGADEIAAEIAEMKTQFQTTWRRERPTVGATMYLLLGKPLSKSFDLHSLAADQALADLETFERLEPLVEDQ